MKKTPKSKPAPKVLYALYDAEGEFFGADYQDEEEAHMDAWGPRFRPRYRVVEYEKKKTKSFRAG